MRIISKKLSSLIAPSLVAPTLLAFGVLAGCSSNDSNDTKSQDVEGNIDAGGEGNVTGTGTGGNSSSSGGSDSSSSGGSSTSSGGADATGGSAPADGTGGGGEQPAGKCAPTANWPAASTQLEAEVLTLTNEARAKGQNCGGKNMPPAGPLVNDSILTCAARLHSIDMDDRMFFTHQNPDGDNPDDRIWGLNYPGNSIGENIARGNGEAKATVDQWIGSPIHCEVLMNANFTKLGVGFVEGGMFDYLWTQNFGD